MEGPQTHKQRTIIRGEKQIINNRKYQHQQQWQHLWPNMSNIHASESGEAKIKKIASKSGEAKIKKIKNAHSKSNII